MKKINIPSPSLNSPELKAIIKRIKGKEPELTAVIKVSSKKNTGKGGDNREK